MQIIMDEDLNFFEEAPQEVEELSAEELIFLDKLNLPEDIFFFQAFEGKVLLIKKMGVNLLFLNDLSQQSYIISQEMEEKAISEQLWHSNLDLDIAQVIIVDSPLEAVYYERLFNQDNSVYVRLSSTKNEALSQFNAFIDKNFNRELLKFKIALKNSVKSFYQELRIIEAITGEKFTFDTKETELCYTSNNNDKIDEVKSFFLKIKENINTTLIRTNFAINDIMILIQDDNIIKLRFPEFDLFKKESRKIILSMIEGLTFFHNIQIHRPNRTNLKELYNWKVINDIYFPREVKKKK